MRRGGYSGPTLTVGLSAPPGDGKLSKNAAQTRTKLGKLFNVVYQGCLRAWVAHLFDTFRGASGDPIASHF